MDPKYILESVFQAFLAGGFQVLFDRIASSDAVNFVKRLEIMMSSLTAVLGDIIAHEALLRDSRAEASEVRESKRPKISSFSGHMNDRDLENGIRNILDRLAEIVKLTELPGLKEILIEKKHEWQGPPPAGLVEEAQVLGKLLVSEEDRKAVMNKLKKAALRVVFEKKVAGVKEIFHHMDTNEGAKVNLEELKSVLRGLGDHQIPATDVKILKDAGAVDKDGSVDYKEVAAFSVDLGEMESDEEGIRKAFDLFDPDEDGFIKIDDLRRAFAMYEEDHIEKIMNAIVQDVDIDKDGKISYEEFATMMKGAVGSKRK